MAMDTLEEHLCVYSELWPSSETEEAQENELNISNGTPNGHGENC